MNIVLILPDILVEQLADSLHIIIIQQLYPINGIDLVVLLNVQKAELIRIMLSI